MGLQGGGNVINNIKELCQKQGITGYKFWKLTGMPQSTAYRLYSDPTAYPSKENLLAICKALHVSPADVFWREDEQKLVS
ncbi:hypothetical protein B7486_50505 [cyanobacterium TDX16]|nr:hypothetical protein B7486_50505 [cyanobacterium TDX16]